MADAPDFNMLANLAKTCTAAHGTATPPVMYIWHNGRSFQTQDYFAHWGPTPYVRADITPPASVVEAMERALRDALDFMGRHSNRWDGINGKHPQIVADEARAALADLEAWRAGK